MWSIRISIIVILRAHLDKLTVFNARYFCRLSVRNIAITSVLLSKMGLIGVLQVYDSLVWAASINSESSFSTLWKNRLFRSWRAMGKIVFDSVNHWIQIKLTTSSMFFTSNVRLQKDYRIIVTYISINDLSDVQMKQIRSGQCAEEHKNFLFSDEMCRTKGIWRFYWCNHNIYWTWLFRGGTSFRFLLISWEGSIPRTLNKIKQSR